MTSNILSIAKEIQQKIYSLVPNNDHLRKSLIHSARTLINAFETPAERIAHMAYAQPATFCATRVLSDLKVLKLLAESDKPLKVSEIAKSVDADERLVARLIKHIAVERFVQETGPDEYIANERTQFLATPGADGTVKDMFVVFPSYGHLPTFLQNNKYANPTNKDTTVFKRREHMLEAFHQHMETKTIGPKWYDNTELLNTIFGDVTQDEKEVVLIDIGGNTGYDILNFHKTHPEIKGRLILQDLPATINKLDKEGLAAQGIEAMSHDAFTPEPIEGAKAYYLKMVLHDWPKEQCIQMLTNLKPALKKGYSRILLNEIVIPDTNAGWFETSNDLLMMVVHGAQERREKEWKELVESVEGLMVRKIWDVEGAVEKVIEIEAV